MASRLYLFFLFAAGTFISTATAALAGDTLTLPATVGAVRFAHPVHAGVACQQCHHRSGATGGFSCSGCHQAENRRDVLHKLCNECHLDLKRRAKPTGPAKLCSRCHK